jgi:four helix bundle protein
MENTDNFKSFEDLDVWKICRELRKKYEKLAKSLLSEEKYRLSDHLIRSSRSTTQNIAEGYGRFYFQENIQVYRISRGSLYELLDH